MFFFKRKSNSEYEEYSWSEYNRPPKLWYVRHLLLLATVAVVGAGIAWASQGPAMVEKLITATLQPVGLVWVALFLFAYFCFLLRRTTTAILIATIWVFMTLAGNQWFSNWFASTLEARYYNIDPAKVESAEYALLLGGSVDTGPNLRSQLNANGDRVAVAAQLYQSSQAKKIICSGSNSFGSDDTASPGQQSFDFLTGLGVPTENMLLITGANTYQEFENLQKWIDAQRDQGKDPGPISIVTSAWHMPRAERLAKARGLNVQPVPANFLSSKLEPSPNWVVPGASQLLVTSQILKEYLASLVNR